MCFLNLHFTIKQLAFVGVSLSDCGVQYGVKPAVTKSSPGAPFPYFLCTRHSANTNTGWNNIENYHIQNYHNQKLNRIFKNFNGDRVKQAVTTCGSLAAGMQENGERMRKWREKEISYLSISSVSLHFLCLLSFSLNLRHLSRVLQKS